MGLNKAQSPKRKKAGQGQRGERDDGSRGQRNTPLKMEEGAKNKGMFTLANIN